MKLPGLLLLAAATFAAQDSPLDFLNHNRPVRDAHNCYPYQGKWADRIDRALAGGFPVAIEQDIASDRGRVVVSHDAETTGSEPLLRDYFFERVRPIIEKALRDNDRAQWPLIVLHFDFKDNSIPLLRAVWEVLGHYDGWYATAVKGANPHELAPFDRKPLLILTEDNDNQEQVFFQDVPVGAKLRLFGSAHTKPVAKERLATAPPEDLLSAPPTNYRRWWNNGWSVVEEGGQHQAGDWTAADNRRLRALVDHAHRLGYWIRFYTLDGFGPGGDIGGWGNAYNFGSREAVLLRWKAVVAAGVNLIASDQYEDLAAVMK
jgi:hypothetical protein